jgi:hypothetical protein
MGMAASQARLLCITARIHDVEFQAQSIQNAKTQLATQSDAAYQEYLRELDDTTLTINSLDGNGDSRRVVATFNNLCSRNRVRSADGKEYAIRDKSGKLLVEQEIADGYRNFKAANSGVSYPDAYAFAMFMINKSDYHGYANGPDDPNTSERERNKGEEAVQYAENLIYEETILDNKSLENKHNAVLKIVQDAYKACNDKLCKKEEDLTIYDVDFVNNCKDKEIQKAYKEAMASYKETLYGSERAGHIYERANEANLAGQEFNVEEDFDNDLFNYYVSIYKQIEACGGCKSISDFDGFNGDASNNEEWLSAMIQSGQFSIETVDKDKNTGAIDMKGTSPSSDISLSFSTTTEIDSRAMRKAEAKYEYNLKKIEAQDKKYDLTLSKLETERTALTTQYDSLKKVIDDNIERTFGIFS